MSHNWSHGTGGSPGGGGNWQGSWHSVGRSQAPSDSRPWGKQQDQSGGKPKRKGSGGRRAHSPLVVASVASHFGRHNPQVAQRRNPLVAESAASADSDFQLNLANMKDLTQQECGEEAKSRRFSKLGQSFMDYRMKILMVLDKHMIMKIFFVVWLKAYTGEDLCMEDLCWTEDDMDHFVHTVASFQTHKRDWRKQLQELQDPWHPHHGEAMPMLIPSSHMRLFQNTLSRVHSDKFKQHFGAATIDGTLRTPFQMLSTQLGKVIESAASVAESVASVAESAARATKFQLRLFMEDTRLAIDCKTSFLDRDEGQPLVSGVRNFTGHKLWMFMMKRVKQIATEPYPIQLRMGYEQSLAAACKGRWKRSQGFGRELSILSALSSVLYEKQPDQEQEQAWMELEALYKEVKDYWALNEETPMEEDLKPQEEDEVADFDSLRPQEPEASPPSTNVPELDEALADLAEIAAAPVAESVASLVAESDAAAAEAVAASSILGIIAIQENHHQIDAAAHVAYDAIKKFRKEMIHPRIKSCIRWIKQNMHNFEMKFVEVFGSTCYHLELCTSDVDVVAILAPGQNITKWLDQLRIRHDTCTSFNVTRGYQRKDCLQASYMGMLVHIKPVKGRRKTDAACRSSDSLRFLIEQRIMQNHGGYLHLKLRALLIFKLLVHHFHIVQHNWKESGGKFNVVSLSFWAVHVLDNFVCDSNDLGDFIFALCVNFLTFEWRHLKVAVSAANQISVEPKGNIRAAIAIMLDGGKVNSTQNVTYAHLEFSQNAIKQALPKLDEVIEEALVNQGIDQRRLELEEMMRERNGVAKVAGSAAEVAGSAARVSSRPLPAKVSGFVSVPSHPSPAKVSGLPLPVEMVGSPATSSSEPPFAKVAGSPASTEPPQPPPAMVDGSAASASSEPTPAQVRGHQFRGPSPEALNPGAFRVVSVADATAVPFKAPPPPPGVESAPSGGPPPPAVVPPPPAADSAPSAGPPPPKARQPPPAARPPLPAAESASSGGPPPPPAGQPPSDVLRPPPPPPAYPSDLMPGEYQFNHLAGIIKAPPEGTDHEAAPIVIIVPPTGGFGLLPIPEFCPKPCWYAYMNFDSGGFKQTLPTEFLEFVQMIHGQAKSRAIIGWGLSRGGKWLIEMVQEHALLDAAVMFAGYPQRNCEHEERACAQELIAIRNCAICLLHFVEEPFGSVPSNPYWHAELEHHMADQVGESVAMVAGSVATTSSLLSLCLPGNYDTAHMVWRQWQVQCNPLFNQWFEMLWQTMTLK